jgi:hypothetical protein
MNDFICAGLDGSDPLGFLAALGLLRVVSRRDPEARLRWVEQGPWKAALETAETDVLRVLVEDVARWKVGHAALSFAESADRKIQDLKHPPAEFRELMRAVRGDWEACAFIAAYATGVVVDGSGKQTKPTALHFTAGQQRFLASVLSVRDAVDRNDFDEALAGPWVGRTGPSDTRWRAGSERSRALLSFDPGSEKPTTVVGAVWLAFQGMPLLPTASQGSRIVTTGFAGRGNSQHFTWPIWTAPLLLDEVRVLVGSSELATITPTRQRARGIGAMFRSDVVRSSQGYGNFAPAQPV